MTLVLIAIFCDACVTIGCPVGPKNETADSTAGLLSELRRVLPPIEPPLVFPSHTAALPESAMKLPVMEMFWWGLVVSRWGALVASICRLPNWIKGYPVRIQFAISITLLRTM